MAVQVPIRCVITITLQMDIDVVQKTAIKNKMTTIIQNLKTEYPDKLTDNKVVIETAFAKDEWKV